MRSPPLPRVRALILAAMAVAAAVPARADEGDARARAQGELDEGNRLFREGDQSGALAHYRAAYELFASPKLFFNIARCEEALGDRAGAMRDFTHFLRDAPEASAEARAEAQERVTALAPLLTSVTIEAETNQLVHVDDQRSGVTPLKNPIWVEPGSHRVSVTRSVGLPWVTTIVAHPGDRLAVAAPPPLPPPPPLSADHMPVPDTPPLAPRPDQPSPSRRWWLWTGIGAILVGGAIAAFLLTRSQCPTRATAGCE